MMKIRAGCELLHGDNGRSIEENLDRCDSGSMDVQAKSRIADSSAIAIKADLIL